ncbi:MAG TPA: 4Fe-4S dicluster domain-containing protein, partial [Bacteroidia bacterium]|nr:4Fe-4S dicluster domain-containing protein [Bacteroidia bacterium]
RPEEIVPGVANWYASTYYDGNDFASVLVKTREGRPIKIEGNTMSPITMGGTNARIQASVLSLYDSKRLNKPQVKSNNAWSSKNWDETDAEIKSKLSASKGIAILSSTINSPSTLAAIAEFGSKYKNVRHIMHDAVSYSGILQANLSSFGSAFIPTYHFEKADVIVSLGCDFLVNWVSPVEHARQYAMGRKVSREKTTMSKHFQFESLLTLTGSNADERFPVKPSQLGQIAFGLLGAMGGTTSSDAVSKETGRVAESLKAAGRKGLVVCGSNDPAIQLIVNEINQKIGAYGITIDKDEMDLTHLGDDAGLQKLVADSGTSIDTVIFYNTNPVYSAPKALGFAEAMKKLSCRISLSSYMDETAAQCDYVCPDHNFLESWNDHNPRSGNYALQQPAIRPLYSTRQAQESLLAWAGNNTAFHDYMQKTWKGQMMGKQSAFGDFTMFWNTTVRDGVAQLDARSIIAEPEVTQVKEPKRGIISKIIDGKEKSDTTATASAAPTGKAFMGSIPSFSGKKITLDEAVVNINNLKGSGYELVIYQSTAIGNGVQSMNPWLQEMPDPVTKITWDNYVTMHPADVKEMGLFGLLEEGEMLVRFDQLEDELDTVNVTVNGHTVKLPVWFQPGQARGTVGIAVGYGRQGFGEVIDNAGQNIYPAAGWSATGNVIYEITSGVKIDKAEGKHAIASTQVHGTVMGRNQDIIRETSLAVFAAGKKDAYNPPVMLHTYKGEQNVEQVNLWNDFDRPNHQWAMSIDLNSCIGCGACVVGCNAENNVPVVGKTEVRRSREMHWIRIDRYYSSNTVKSEAEASGEIGMKEMYRAMENPAFDNPKVVFQPVMCQHCNHAPCETVCPVIATNHSSEGLNQMTYNRCVGTRYCANNCPYKVRRFNWFNYNEYHRFKGINPAQDDVGRMVLNPDVVVRSRGVMEKCSLCVQRIQAGKLDAKKAGRRPADGEIVTACAQACPTNAITFGDLNDTNSNVSKLFNDDRKFEMLEVIGTRPSVFYLAKVWNRDNAKDHV